MQLKVLDNSGDITRHWLQHKNVWAGCKECVIGRLAHSHVFARGIVPCDILFVGEAPGRTEDATGWPFVGKSGKLLEDWIAAAWDRVEPTAVMWANSDPGLDRVERMAPPAYAITNTVLCRPCDRPGGPNRAPSLQEISNCKPRFEDFVRNIAQPKVIVTVGRVAADNRTWAEIPTLALRHPAYALRLSQKGRAAESELQTEKLASFIKDQFYGEVISR